MGIVAGMLVQNTLKYLLNFGTVSNYLGYNALIDFFPKMDLRPNPQCDDSWCRQRQVEYQARPKEEKIEQVEEVKIVHEENEWGIELVSEDDNATVTSTTSASTGLKYSFEPPTSTSDQAHSTTSPKDEISLEDLMAQMKSI